jgi:predicted ATP-grasp superfamily ATP-dependent carboligase
VVVPARFKGRFTAERAAHAARDLPADLVAYTSNFENAPDAVAQLARGRELLGNSPETLRRVRRPVALMRALARRGFRVPRTRASAPEALGDWLLKPLRSGGGHGVARWRGRPPSRRQYLQERVRGQSGSIVFVADGRRAVPLGLTRQLTGEPAFGAHGFAYCGSLVAGAEVPLFDREDALRPTAEALAAAVTEEFGLVGLNGIDFIARDGVPYPIEVNPRICASMELFERLGGPGLFELHLHGCRGELPAPPRLPGHRVAGKGVVFARRTTLAPDLGCFGDWVADVPHPGERIGRGHPVCTVFAEGAEMAECHRALVDRAADIYALLEPRARGAA